jgi:A/G-specific adenine glycosylase
MAERIGHALFQALQSKTTHSKRSLRSFRSDLVGWHKENTRTYSWRSGVDPWAVLVAEMCLHRTRADQAERVFSDLIRIAPCAGDLIASEDAARMVMSSLGLRWRIDNVVRVAHVLVDRYGGQVPSTRSELLALPGVGDYVANAVLCFGFGKPSVLMDTNTARIVSRVSGHGRMGHTWQLRLDLYRLAGRSGADAEFNYALLDLGALVCRASSPRCLTCPVARHCQTFLASEDS